VDKSKEKLADLMAEYILDDRSERSGYEDWCFGNGINPQETNDLRHIYGIALEYIRDTL